MHFTLSNLCTKLACAKRKKSRVLENREDYSRRLSKQVRCKVLLIEKLFLQRANASICSLEIQPWDRKKEGDFKIEFPHMLLKRRHREWIK